MDPAMRDYIRHSSRVEKPVTPERLAPCRPFELRRTSGRQSRAKRGSRIGEGRRTPVALPPAASDFVFLESIPVLSQFNAGFDCVSDMGAPQPRSALLLAARAVHFRSHRHVASALALR